MSELTDKLSPSIHHPWRGIAFAHAKDKKEILGKARNLDAFGRQRTLDVGTLGALCFLNELDDLCFLECLLFCEEEAPQGVTN